MGPSSGTELAVQGSALPAPSPQRAGLCQERECRTEIGAML